MKTKILILIALAFISGNAFAQLEMLNGEAVIPGSLTIGDSLVANKSLTILGPENAGSTNSIIFDNGGKRASIKVSNGSSIGFLFTEGSNEYIPMNIHKNTTSIDGISFIKQSSMNQIDHPLYGTKLNFDQGGHTANEEVFFQRIDYSGFKSDLFLYLNTICDYKIIGFDRNSPFFMIRKDSLNHKMGKVGINTSNPKNELDVNGTIRAKEVVVETDWADFVFDKDYKLPSLDEVKAHIDAHKQLPGIPSGTEVKENGVGLAEITTKLLQKVEELTLYAIQQQETINKLNKRIKDIETKDKK